MDFFGGAKPKERAQGRAVVTTARVSQAAPPPRPKVSTAARHNALPEAVRQRIESSRAEAAQAQARAAAAAAARSDAPAPQPKKRAKKEHKRVQAVARTPERDASPRSVLDQRPGIPFHYAVTRPIVPDAAYTGSAPTSSRALVRESTCKYGTFFENLDDNTVVSLEYPAQDTSEEYVRSA